MEFLLCVEDLGDYDSGDILEVRPDGFEWGKEERANPVFKIIRVPDEEVAPKGESLEETQEFYIHTSIGECPYCKALVSSDSIDVHMAVSHNGIPSAGINLVKNKVWKFDLENDVLIKKSPDSSKSGSIKLQAEYDFSIENVT